MLTNTPRTWVAGTAVLSVLLFVASWFLLIAPQRTSAAALRAQAVSARAANVAERDKLAQLRQEFIELPDRQAELAALATHVPATLDIDAFSRELSATAASSGVTLMSIAPGIPASPPAAVDGTSTAATAVDTPVTVEVVGSYEEAQVFLSGLEKLSRDVLVTGLSFTPEESSAASGGKPATSAGDVTADITAHVFTLPAVLSATTTTGTTGTGAAGATTTASPGASTSAAPTSVAATDAPTASAATTPAS